MTAWLFALRTLLVLAASSVDSTGPVDLPGPVVVDPAAPLGKACVLLRDSRLLDAPPPLATADAIAAQADSAVAELLRVLADGRVPGLIGAPDAQILSVPQRDIVLAALAQLGARPVRAGMAQLLAERNDDAARAAALRVHALHGGALDVRYLLDLTRSAQPEEPVAPAVAEAFEWALARLLRRDGASISALEPLVVDERAELLAAVVHAIGSAPEPRGIRLLHKIAVRYPELANEVMAEVRRVGPSPDPDDNASLAEFLRTQLDPEGPTSCAAAALALGELGDFEALEALIGLLEAQAEASAEATWALEHMTGLAFGSDPAHWRRWYEEERAWYERDWRQLVDELHGAQAARAAAAVREISRHRIHREELVTELAFALRHAPHERRAMICAALQAVGSPLAVPVLIETLSDGAEVVRVAAHKALVALTGHQLEPDADVWRLALEEAKRVAEWSIPSRRRLGPAPPENPAAD